MNTRLTLRPGALLTFIPCLIAFALYAESVSVMPLHDDSHILARIRELGLFEVFLPDSSGGVEYRPAGTLFWMITRALSGGFVPGLLHMWNIMFHTANTALVEALFGGMSAAPARHAGPATHARRAALAGLLFATFPLSYQAIIAGAIYHPAMMFYGLAALVVWLRTRRLALPLILIMAAALSHEAGFIFGPLLLLVEYAAPAAKRAPDKRVLAGLLILAWPVAYRLLLRTMWTPASGMLTTGVTDLAPKLAYYIHGLLWPLALLLQLAGFAAPAPAWLLLGLAAAGGGIALCDSPANRRMAAAGLLWWLIAIAPNIAALPLHYVTDTPRLMYVSSAGAAIFWVAVFGSAWRYTPALARLGLVAALICAAAWSARYIRARQTEVIRLSRPFQMITADLRQAPDNARVLLINPPFVMLPARPSFDIGREGFSLWEPGNAYGPIANWLASMGGRPVAGAALLDEATLSDRNPDQSFEDRAFTRGGEFLYGVFGERAGAEALRGMIGEATYVYRFEYDRPGLRLITIAAPARDMPNPGAPMARMRDGGFEFDISAAAIQCPGYLLLDTYWRRVSGPGPGPVNVFAHAYSDAGVDLYAADKNPYDGLLRPDQLPQGIVIHEQREIRQPPGGAPVSALRIGLYRSSDGGRLRTLRANGQLWEGEEIRLPVGGASSYCVN